MTREFSDELLSAYLDDQLSAQERAEVESQLAASPEHRRLLAELRALSSDVRALPRALATADFADRVVQAAVAAQGRSAAVAPAARNAGRRNYWSYAVAAMAAAAACVAIAVFVQNGGLNLPGGNNVVQVPVEPPQTSPVEQALASLRSAAPGEDEAIVVKIRVGQGLAPHQVLDAALADAGIVHRDPSDTSTKAYAVGGSYRRQVTGDATHAAEDVVYLEAPWSQLESTVAALGELSTGKIDVQPLATVALPKSALPEGSSAEAEGHDGHSTPAVGSTEPFAQRLPARMYKLENEPAASHGAPPATAPSIDGQKRVRVLILVERDAE